MGRDPKTGFTVLTSEELADSLAFDLSDVADDLRDLNTEAGLRPYRVTMVRVKWTGGKRRVGEAYFADDPVLLLPNPLVGDLSGLSRELTLGGMDENGSILLSEVPRRYGEDFLRGLDQDGNPPEPDESVWVEIQWQNPDGLEAEPRAFVVSSAPYYDTENFGWRMMLTRQTTKGRSRKGGPRA